MTLSFLILQTLPFIASFVYTIAYRTDNGRLCSALSIIGFLIYTAYNYGMSATMALTIAPLGILFIIATIFIKQKQFILCIASLYIVAAWVLFTMQYQAWFDVFAIIATTLSTLSLIYQNCSVKRKSLGAISSISWVIYGLHLGAIGQIITCTIFAISTLQSLMTQNLNVKLRPPSHRKYGTRRSGFPAIR